MDTQESLEEMSLNHLKKKKSVNGYTVKATIVVPSDIRLRFHDITPLAKIRSYGEMIKVDESNFLKKK